MKVMVLVPMASRLCLIGEDAGGPTLAADGGRLASRPLRLRAGRMVSCSRDFSRSSDADGTGGSTDRARGGLASSPETCGARSLSWMLRMSTRGF